MKLYMIHCGFYDEEISEGIYEFHVNIPVVATDVEGAKNIVRTDSSFQKKKMHTDDTATAEVKSKMSSSIGFDHAREENLMKNPTSSHNLNLQLLRSVVGATLLIILYSFGHNPLR